MNRNRARILVAAATLLLTVLAIGTPPAFAAPGRPFANPIKSVKGADPWIQYYQGSYYMITTSWTSVLTMRRSPTLAGLATAPSVVVWSDTTASRCCNMWAPEIHFLNNRWYLYYTAGTSGTNYANQRLHVLESAGTDPMGPYTYRARVRHASIDGWLIDGSVVRINNQLYLLASVSAGTQNLVIAPMSNPYTVSGNAVTISTPTNAWERQGGTVNEGPVALQRDGRTFIVYSASACWGPDYKLGLLTLTGSNPLSAGSWTKSPNPVFQRNDGNACTARPQRLLHLAGRHRELDRLPRQQLGRRRV
jgi:GH43 family beta-xylosidase